MRDRLSSLHPPLGELFRRSSVAFALNEEYAAVTQGDEDAAFAAVRVSSGDVVAIIPPVSGTTRADTRARSRSHTRPSPSRSRRPADAGTSDASLPPSLPAIVRHSA